MQTCIGTITSDIVEFTGNPDTGQFVGLKVMKKISSDGTDLFTIEGTKHSLSDEEVSLFIENNVLKSSLGKDAESRDSDDPENIEYEQVILLEESMGNQSQAYDPKYDQMVQVGSKAFHETLEQSEFFSDENPPIFVWQYPAYAPFLDFKESVSESCDAFGRRVKDRFVGMMNKKRFTPPDDDGEEKESVY